MHWCQCTWQTHFANLQEMSFSRVASFCHCTVVLGVGWSPLLRGSRSHVQATNVRPEERFTKRFVSDFYWQTVISYWNPRIWLAESKSASENHWQDALWNAPQVNMFWRRKGYDTFQRKLGQENKYDLIIRNN